ncbi:MAG: 30S ribosome-binding factor RbfA [Chloroflexi bacterium]|nr:30S ribosome-binding factor RbfA [Chloroflexota bacterium]
MSNRRIERLNHLLRKELSELLQRELRDPRLAGLMSITSVELSSDLRHARIYISALGGQTEQKQSLDALRNAAGFLRHELATRLTLRTVPDLDFQIDTSMERADRIMRLLRESQTDPPGGSTGPEGNASQ